MFRFILPLLLMAPPAWAQEERIATLDSNGRELRVPLDDGYVQVSSNDGEFFEAFSVLMNTGKANLIELLATEQDLARLNEGQDAHAMLYKISTDAMFGVSIVGERQWVAAKPQYLKAIAGVDMQEVGEKIDQRLDAFVIEHAGEDAGLEFRLGEISGPTLYRSDALSFRFHATIPATLISEEGVQKAIYLCFGAVVHLNGRVFVFAGEVVAPKDAEGFARERRNFERFVDRIIVLNGATIRG